MHGQRGAITFGPIIGIIVIVLAFIGLFTLCSDDDDDLITDARPSVHTVWGDSRISG